MGKDLNIYSKIGHGFLLATAFCCGSIIMIIEVLGSRVIGPFFGVSLFVWTSLIAVAMISLAIGYAVGGYFADRYSDIRYLYIIIFLAGISIIPIPFIKTFVLKFSVAFGLRAGAFISSLLLFGPTLFLLGCVSPYLIKIVARKVSNIGSTVGAFYAVSTIGSVFGTAITGFVLISYMAVSQIFFLVSGILILLATSYFIFIRRFIWLAVVPVFTIIYLLEYHDNNFVKTRILPNGARVEVLAQEDSYYGNVKVLQYSFGEKRNRELVIDGLVQGGIDVGTGLSYYPYNYFLQSIPIHINSTGRRCLVIGLGAGVIPLWYEQRGVVADVVDIDPTVVSMAQEYFNFENVGSIYVEDARYFLSQNQTKYDYIILDVFNGDTTPSHIISFEAFELAYENLSENGVLGINLVAAIKGKNLISTSIVKTLREIFDQVDLIPMFNPDFQHSGNVVVLAYDGERVEYFADLFRDEEVHPFARKNLSQFRVFDLTYADALVLSDDFNPMDSYDLELKESNRQDILDTTDWEILLQ